MSDTATSTEVKQQLKLPSAWKVIIHDDDFTPVEFVVALLIAIFGKDEAEAKRLTWQVHETGKGIAGMFTKEVALTKVNLARQAADQFQHPLLITAEQA